MHLAGKPVRIAHEVPVPAEEARAACKKPAPQPPVERVPTAPRADHTASLENLLATPGGKPHAQRRAGHPLEPRHARSVPNVRAEPGRPPREQVVQVKAGDPESGDGQVEGHRAAARKMNEPAFDALGADLEGREDAEALEVAAGASGEKLSADLGPRKPVLLEEDDAAPRRRKDRSRSRAGRARADDDRVVRGHAPPVTSNP